METTIHHNGTDILFESVGIADKHDYGAELALDGFTKVENGWVKTHKAIGYALGGEITEVKNIEEV